MKRFFRIGDKGMVFSLNKFQNGSLSIYHVKMLLDTDSNEMDFAHSELSHVSLKFHYLRKLWTMIA